MQKGKFLHHIYGLLPLLILIFTWNTSSSQPVVFQKFISDVEVQNGLLFPDGDYFIQAFDTSYINKYLLRLDKNNGNIKWTRHLPDTLISENCSQNTIIYLITDRETFVGVKSHSCFSMSGNLTFESEFFECDSDGNVLWSHASSDIYNVSKVFDLHNGQYIFFGSLDVVANSGEPIFGIMDTSGQMLSLKKINNPSVRSFYDVIQTTDTGYAAIGRFYNGLDYDAMFMKFDSSMSCQFGEYFNLGGEDYTGKIIEMPDHSYLFSSTRLGDDTTFLVHIDPTGQPLNSIQINTPISSFNLCEMDSAIYIPFTKRNPNQSGLVKLNYNHEILWTRSLSDTVSQGSMYLKNLLKGDHSLLISAGTQLYSVDSAFNNICFSNPMNFSIDTITPVANNLMVASFNFGNVFSTQINFALISDTINMVDTCFGSTMSIPVNGNEALSFEIFPNPVSGYLNIKYKIANFSELKMRIIDITGKVIYFKSLGYSKPGIKEFSFSNLFNQLADGIYFIQMENSDQRITRRFIVSNDGH